MGAFEDRLAAGYRQAANTPAKMPQPTTQTEALAEQVADFGVHVAGGCDTPDECFSLLVPGWRLVGPDDVTVTVDGLARALEEAALEWSSEKNRLTSCVGEDAERVQRAAWALDAAADAYRAALSADKEGQK